MNTLLNRDFKLPADGWHHVVPLGEFLHPQTGTMQVLDNRAAGEMVKDFQHLAEEPNFPGLLVDFDHFSDDPSQSSAAAGWLYEMQNRGDGLWGKIRWSDVGEEAVKGGRYRLVSPVFPPASQCEEAGNLNNSLRTEVRAPKKESRRRPLRLVKLALTNDPNLKGMVPLSNRAGAGTGVPALAEQQTKKQMSRINTLLGLSAEATEDAAVAELTKLQNRAALADNLEKENAGLLTAQVESDLEKYKNRFKPESKDKMREHLLKNRGAAIELLEMMPEIGGKPADKPLHNRAGAGAPPPVTSEDARALAARAETKVQEIRLGNRCSYETAYNLARLQHPEMFGVSQPG